MTKRIAALGSAISLAFGERFTVDCDRRTVCVTHDSGGRAVIHLEQVDGRTSVTEGEVSALVDRISAKFRSDATDPRFTDRARRQSACAIADLPS